MNWGKGLMMALVAFAGMMAYFVVRATQSTEPLISEHYYAQELRFQERIDARSRAMALSSAVRIDASREQVQVTFPAEVKERAPSGTLLLLHASRDSDDRTLAVRATGGQFEEAVTLNPGRYIAQLEWTVDSLTYYSEEQLIVP